MDKLKFCGYIANRVVYYDKSLGTWHLIDKQGIILESGKPSEIAKKWHSKNIQLH